MDDSNRYDSKYSLGQKIVHYLCGHVTKDHFKACKTVLAFHAGVETSKMRPMSKQSKQEACMVHYQNAIDALDPLLFDVSHSGYQRGYYPTRATIRNHMMPLFPSNLCSMKSGKGFHNSFQDVIVKQFQLEKQRLMSNGVPKYTVSQTEKKLPPMNWEYKTNPWVMTLTLKIFRCDPQLAQNVTDVLDDMGNVTLSRAEMKRKQANEKAVLDKKKARAMAGWTAAVNSTYILNYTIF